MKNLTLWTLFIRISLSVGEYQPSTTSINLNVFIGFSQYLTAENYENVQEMLLNVVEEARRRNNTGNINIFAPRTSTVAICEGNLYLKCDEEIINFPKNMTEISTGPVNDNDLEFSPDVLIFMRNEYLKRGGGHGKVLVLILSDFISQMMNRNSNFFQMAEEKQNMGVLMSVVNEWNGMNHKQMTDHYRNLSSLIDLVAIDNFRSLDIIPRILFNTSIHSHYKVNSSSSTPLTSTLSDPTNRKDSTTDVIKVKTPIKKSSSSPTITIISVGVSALSVAVILLFYNIYKRFLLLRRENKVLTLSVVQKSLSLEEKERNNIETGSYVERHEERSNFNDDPWEMDRQRLIINDQIGKGSFGVVFRGSLIGHAPVEYIHKKTFFVFQFDNCSVAVKMMPLHYEEHKRKAFVDEIETMKTLPPHPNICSLLGCVTSYSPLCMIVEYAEKGDILSYFKKNRLIDICFSNCSGHDSSLLCYTDIVSICWQICEGMKYLHGNGLIHRDLAARNILLKSSNNIIISDFGLAIWKDKPNIVRSGDKLPVKWTAIEALNKGEFSEQSDVWSFGVCAWELFSSGAEPFSFLNPAEVLAYIASGKRLRKPEHIADDIWSLIVSCWKDNSLERPAFSALRDSFGIILEELTKVYGYLELKNRTASIHCEHCRTCPEHSQPRRTTITDKRNIYEI